MKKKKKKPVNPLLSEAARSLAALSRLNPTKAQREASKRNGALGGRPKGSKNKKKKPSA